MPFQKMTRPTHPPRLWSLVGYPGSGKSTFASQLRGPSLIIDADHRYSEVLDLALGEVYKLSPRACDNTDPDTITRLLTENMPDSDVRTIVVDSLTSIITPYVVQAMVDRERGRTRNLIAAFKDKALAMRQLQDAVTRWGTDVLWIYHLQDSRDAKAEAVVRKTISQTELARLTRSINLQLQITHEGTRRGVEVLWARRGRSGLVLWDDSGHWEGMPERLEEAVYGGLSQAEQRSIDRQTPKVFRNAEAAIAWSIELGAFTADDEARRVYNQLKNDERPRNAHEMAALWVTEVRARERDAPVPSLRAV